MRALHAFPCSRAKLPHGVSYILRALFLPRAPHLQAAFSRKLSSCNEHVAEANFSRPHPQTSRVLCTVPTLSSKLERSEKQLNFLVRETCAHYMHFLVPGPNCHTEFLTFFLLRAFFLPRVCVSRLVTMVRIWSTRSHGRLNYLDLLLRDLSQ